MITARPNAPLGIVETLAHYSPDLFVPGSVVLCRNTAPLVSMCYNLISRDVPCRIAGKDIGAGLIALVKSFNAASMNELRIALEDWHIAKVNAALEAKRSPESYDDKFFAISTVMQGLDFVVDVCRRIERIFDDTPDTSVLLSTIHKFKGGEASRVFLLDFHRLLPSRYATRPWQLAQERNLQYVAVTRSKEELFFIESDKWKDEEMPVRGLPIIPMPEKGPDYTE